MLIQLEHMNSPVHVPCLVLLHYTVKSPGALQRKKPTTCDCFKEANKLIYVKIITIYIYICNKNTHRST